MNGREITAETARSFSATLAAQIQALEDRKLPVVAGMLLSLLRDAGAHLGALLAEHDFASAAEAEEEREIDELIARVKDEMRAEAQWRIEAAIAPVPPPCLPLRARSPELECGAIDDMVRCTAVQGHQPLDHAAWDEDGTLLASWPVTVPFTGLTRPRPDALDRLIEETARTEPARRISDAAAPRPCQCPEENGMVRHQKDACTDPVVIRLGWYYDPDAVIQFEQAAPVPDLPLPVVENGEVVDLPVMCWHRGEHPGQPVFDCGNEKKGKLPPPGDPENRCGLGTGTSDGSYLICTAGRGHAPADHVGHGPDGVVIGHWKAEPHRDSDTQPDPGHDLNMPHHVGYDDWRSCPPNCPHLRWAVGQGLTGGHAGGPLVTGAGPLAVPANRTGGET